MAIDRRLFVAGCATVLACGKSARAAEGDALWVSATGDDRHPGTREQPLESLHEAYRRDTERVILLPGRHLPAHLTGAKKHLEAPWGGVTIAGISQSRPRFGLDRDSRDAWGFEKRVPVETPGAEIVREIWLNVIRDATLTIEGGIVFEGGGIYATNSDITIRSCILKFSEGNAVTMFGGRFHGEAVRVHAPQGDGFNYNDDCVAFGRDCWASDAGYGESRELTSNGSSSHGCMVTRYGGLYEFEHGPRHRGHLEEGGSLRKLRRHGAQQPRRNRFPVRRRRERAEVCTAGRLQGRGRNRRRL